MTSSVKDVMTSTVVAVKETAGFKHIVSVMRRRGVSAFPVLDAGDRVVGVISEADLLMKEVGPEPFTGPAKSVLATGRRGERAKATGLTAAELMSKPAVTIGLDATVAQAAKLMYTRRVKRLPVVVDDGRLVGIISRVDVLSVFDRPDDEIRAEVVKNAAKDSASAPDAFGVTVKGGIVTITGRVASHAVAAGLIDAIRYIEGVVDVRDRLSYPTESPPSDAAPNAGEPAQAGRNRPA